MLNKEEEVEEELETITDQLAGPTSPQIRHSSRLRTVE